MAWGQSGRAALAWPGLITGLTQPKAVGAESISEAIRDDFGRRMIFGRNPEDFARAPLSLPGGGAL